MPAPRPDTILDDPMLGGRTLHVWRETGWEAWWITPQGGLTPAPRAPAAAPSSWRTPTAA